MTYFTKAVRSGYRVVLRPEDGQESDLASCMQSVECVDDDICAGPKSKPCSASVTVQLRENSVLLLKALYELESRSVLLNFSNWGIVKLYGG